jgi:DNA-binding XRE family transcriptional regulator
MPQQRLRIYCVLRSIRIIRGLTQVELAASLDMPRNTIINIEQGFGCRLDIAQAIARKLQLTIEDIWPYK